MIRRIISVIFQSTFEGGKVKYKKKKLQMGSSFLTLLFELSQFPQRSSNIIYNYVKLIWPSQHRFFLVFLGPRANAGMVRDSSKLPLHTSHVALPT